MNRNVFFLSPLPPFRLDLTVWTLRRRTDNAVDRWDGHTYRRVLPLAGTTRQCAAAPVEIAVTQSGSSEVPRLRVAVEAEPLDASVKAEVSAALHRLLGLGLDLGPFYRFAANHPPLSELAQRFRGMKPPRYASVFEGAINAIACQQLTLTVGIRLLNRLAAARGVAAGDGTAHAFPGPQDLAGMSPSALRAIGFSRQKARATLELADLIRDGHLDLEALDSLSDDAALTRLRELHGVGRWTAEYVLLRGLGRLHVFPGDDVGGRNNLQKWLGLRDGLDYDGVARRLARWRPFGGLIYLHLLLNRLAAGGMVQVNAIPSSKGQASSVDMD